MSERVFLPVGGTDGGETDKPFRIELWHHILSYIDTDYPRIALLTTPSKLSGGVIDVEVLIANYKSMEDRLRCSFSVVDEQVFGRGDYDEQFDALCITCGNTQGSREFWTIHGCEETIRKWYNRGTVVTGYSAGFISFFELASTNSDSVPRPEGAEFGVMPCMGIIKGGAIPHANTQKNRISNFQRVLREQQIFPVLALGEDVMAEYRNEKLIRIVSPVESPLACLVEVDKFTPLDIEPLHSIER